MKHSSRAAPMLPESGGTGNCLRPSRIFIAGAVLSLALSCAPSPLEMLMPLGDLKPPSILDFGQTEAAVFKIMFDEAVVPIERTFAFSPESTSLDPLASGTALLVSLDPPAEPGAACDLAGEVEDGAGNRTRFMFSFAAFNSRPAALRLNEVQTGRNTSASNFHRDYIEFAAIAEGNLGGVCVQWRSTVKSMEYSFPPCDVRAGEVILLHLLPEGREDERDESGFDIGLSGGVDASPNARDFWTKAGGLPDETGAVLLRGREGDPPMDGLVYASEEREGPVESERIASALSELASAELWTIEGSPRWEDCLRWKPSTSKPLHRADAGSSGAGSWMVGESGSQSPGLMAQGRPRGRLKK